MLRSATAGDTTKVTVMIEYNLQQHISTGFEVSSLPKTIQDSITIT